MRALIYAPARAMQDKVSPKQWQWENGEAWLAVPLGTEVIYADSASQQRGCEVELRRATVAEKFVSLDTDPSITVILRLREEGEAPVASPAEAERKVPARRWEQRRCCASEEGLPHMAECPMGSRVICGDYSGSGGRDLMNQARREERATMLAEVFNLVSSVPELPVGPDNRELPVDPLGNDLAGLLATRTEQLIREASRNTKAEVISCLRQLSDDRGQP